MGGVEESLRSIRAARDRGVRVSTESFPYNAGSTSNTAAVFNRDWRKVFAIDYEDVEVAATGERFTEATWGIGTIIDNATFQDPYPPSTGIAHVLVGGTFVVRNGRFQEGVHPGKRVLPGE